MTTPTAADMLIKKTRLTMSSFFLTVSVLLSVVCSTFGKDSYYIGVGRYDVTGPAAEINMVRWLYYIYS